jgi:hypothetical protein
MEENQAKWLLFMVIAAFVLGLVVIYVKDDYRFKPIIKSNQNYFPSIEVEAP